MPPAPATPRLSPTVWLLGFVSLLMDISSEMVQTLMPLYLVAGLGASVVAIGLIEGAAVVVAMATRLLAGMASDRWRRRKWLAVVGYGLSALSRPFFPLADSALGIAGARSLDRVGKGIRSAPRDAMIADVTPPAQHGQAFGLRKSLDTVGGFLGPLIAVALMLVTGQDMVLVFWLAAVPALLAVLLLGFGVREPAPVVAPAATQTAPVPRQPGLWRTLPRSFWSVVAVAVALGLARFSEAYLLLKANQNGVGMAWVPLVVVGLHAVYGLSAYPAGRWSDRVGRRGLLVASLMLLVAAHLAFAWGDGLVGLVVGIVLWGLHMGCSQGVLSAWAADAAPRDLRGTAFGVLNLATGLAALVGNVAAGLLWASAGPAVMFLAAALVASLALLMLTSQALATARQGSRR